MFKKLKDKLAEEVKSSPQRIQQFAQAAQAAVTSASSSISDITNSDLFSIGDNESQSGHLAKSSSSDQKNTFQNVALVQPSNIATSSESVDLPSQDFNGSQRQRKLSNSSFASDVSFRLPSYESPSMYHLQSDMEISASEAEERGFSGGAVSLDRVTKEQIYAAYRRTQDRYTKYRTQYADLARHYKLLERENAKAKSVLVETQDKALRRISELREQCALEQSAKAHLEKALRVELEEKTIKIDTLNTKIQLLQSNNVDMYENDKKENNATNENNLQLISFDNENNQTTDESASLEITALNSKIEKFEKLVTKYKESLKTTKEKNAQLTTEIQILSNELESKKKDIEQLTLSTHELDATKQQVQELIEINEQFQNKINAFDFNKSKEISTLEIDFQKSREEIAQLQSKIDVFTKREEEYAISLAENKLSIHKELEGKESEIKSLKDRLSESKQEIQSLNIVINDYKNNISHLEDESSKHKSDVSELNLTRTKLSDLESQLQILSQRSQMLETSKSKANEEYKCLQLQLKQETAEKLAMIDRNVYLEERNTQLSDENTKKSLQINTLENELKDLRKEMHDIEDNSSEKQKLKQNIEKWKNKYSVLESEIQEERVELVKLQSEIEKLLTNHEHVQLQNKELNFQLEDLQLNNDRLLKKQLNADKMISAYNNLILQIRDLQKLISLTSQETKSLKDISNHEIMKLTRDMNNLLNNIPHSDDLETLKIAYEEQKNLHYAARIELKQITEEYQTMALELNSLRDETNKLKSEISNNELKRHDVEEKIRHTNEEYERVVSELEILKNDNKVLKEHFDEFQVKNQQKNESMTAEITYSKKVINNLELGINDSELKRQDLEKILRHSNEECDRALNELETLKNEKKILEDKFDKSQSKCQRLQNLLDQNSKQQSSLKQDITDMADKIQKLEHDSALLNTEINESKKEQENNLNQIINLKEENSSLISKLHNASDTQMDVEKFQQNIKDLTQENVYLQTQSEGIANIIKDLEIELREVKQSHADIKLENDRMNLVIQQLKISEGERNIANKDTETVKEDTAKTLEEACIVGELSVMKTEKTEAYNVLVSENDLLKEENKRLQSDVTGLQSYLAKISKENSELNDKLRELIASSENLSDKNEIDQNLTELKDKLDDLIRENTLLLEENLELKDQLNSQNYVKPGVSTDHNSRASDYLNMQEKYSTLQDSNIKLEKRMLDLESMNKSVNGNMLQMQEQNEKLRLTNEKLERRLDEALVSLRHLHSLQENTELEYLRNILYEYLTGTGAHSVTLAKVLAAIVKFDDIQTQLILQKEKERQGFLRQLGLL